MIHDHLQNGGLDKSLQASLLCGRCLCVIHSALVTDMRGTSSGQVGLRRFNCSGLPHVPVFLTFHANGLSCASLSFCLLIVMCLAPRVLTRKSLSQDIVSLACFVAIYAFRRSSSPIQGSEAGAGPCDSPHRRSETSEGEASSHTACEYVARPGFPALEVDYCLLGFEAARAFGILAFVLGLTVLLGSFLNKILFKLFATTDGEMLFIGSMAWNLGAAALCQLAGFSPHAGAYLAGLSLSSHPACVEIQNKVDISSSSL
jgi:hypothetical protein